MTGSAGGTKVGLGIAGGAAVVALLASPGETFRSIEWVWTFLLTIIDNGPITLWAVLLAVLAGWLVTLRVNMLPLRWLSPAGVTLLAQFAGTVASFTVIWFLWREPLGLIVGGIVALSTPYTWALFLIVLEVCPGPWAKRWASELRGEGRSLLEKPDQAAHDPDAG